MLHLRFKLVRVWNRAKVKNVFKKSLICKWSQMTVVLFGVYGMIFLGWTPIFKLGKHSQRINPVWIGKFTWRKIPIAAPPYKKCVTRHVYWRNFFHLPITETKICPNCKINQLKFQILLSQFPNVFVQIAERTATQFLLSNILIRRDKKTILFTLSPFLSLNQ